MSNEMSHAHPLEIGVDDLAGLVSSGVRLIDVRQPDEYEDGHVPGAILVPLAEVPDRVAEFGSAGDVVYVVCKAGGRSARACEFVRRSGVHAVNVAGGTDAWILSGRASVEGPLPS